MTSRDEVQIRLGLDNSDVKRGSAETESYLSQVAGGITNFNTKGREMRKLLGEFNQFAPGLGEVLKGIFNPEALGIFLAIAGVELLIGWWKKSQEAAKEAIKRQIESVIALRKSMDEAKEQAQSDAESFAKAMEKSQQTINEVIKAKTEERKVLLEDEAQAYKKLIKLQEERELAAAKGNAAEEQAIRKRYDALEAEVTKQTQAQSLENQRKEKTARTGAETFLKGKLDTLKDAQQELDLDQGFINAKAVISRGGTSEQALLEKIRDLSKPGFLEQQGYGPGIDIKPLREAREKQLAAAKQELADLRAASEIVLGHNKAVKKLDDELSRTEADYTANHEALTALNGQIQITEKKQKIANQTGFNKNSSLGADLLAAETPISPQLQKFLDLRQRLLSGRMNANDLALYGGEARREFGALSLTDQINAMRPENLPAQLRNDASQTIFEQLLDLAKGQGLKVQLPTDD